MDRKNFLRNSVLTGSSLIAAPSGLKAFAGGGKAGGSADHHGFNLKYAPHLGMFRNHGGEDPLDQIRFMADQGFTAFEDNRMMGRTPEMQEKIGSLLANLGMEMGVFVIDKGGNSANSFTAGEEEYTEIFVNACKEAVEVAQRVNATWMTVVPGNYTRSLPEGIQTSNVIETLRRGAEILEPHGLVMVLEPLSDTPDLYLRYSDQTYEICRAVDSPSCKILYDVYHMQRNEGNLIRNMELCWDEIAYLQVGDVPGRREPGTGEINFLNLFEWVYEQGFEGIVGMEHGNAGRGKQGEQDLIDAYRAVDSFR